MRYGGERYEYVQETFIEGSIDRIAEPGKPNGPEEFLVEFRGYCVEEGGIISCEYIQFGLMPSEAHRSKPPSKWWTAKGGAVSDTFYELVEQSREAELEGLRHGSEH